MVTFAAKQSERHCEFTNMFGGLHGGLMQARYQLIAGKKSSGPTHACGTASAVVGPQRARLS
jgi:hypothetical protein